MMRVLRNRFSISIFLLGIASAGCFAQQKLLPELVWSDEFNANGPVDGSKWVFEKGFVRNYEVQWYSPDNAYQKDGLLVIEAREADAPCPAFVPGSRNWRTNRERISYTSSSITTKDRFSFRYGSLEVRARIPVCKGAWPAIWTLGDEYPWPANGEIDIMEYYQADGRPTILANACWASDNEDDPHWDSSYTPLSHFTQKDPEWAHKFHIWKMDWSDTEICIYLDDELLNRIDLTRTINGNAGDRPGTNPFHNPQHILLNLALDKRVEAINHDLFPIRYEIDYVRVWKR